MTRTAHLAGILLMLSHIPGLTATDANLRLELAAAVGRNADSLVPLHIDLELRSGAWPHSGWAWCHGYCQRQHPVRVVQTSGGPDGAATLELEVTITGDWWSPAGSGRYQVTIAADGGAQHTGSFTITGQAQVRDWRRSGESGWYATPAAAPGAPLAVGGAVRLRRDPAWPALLPGHIPLAASEHPRLIFRHQERDALRSFVSEDPVGKAMLARLREVTATSTGTEEADKFSTWPAIGHGALFQFTGDAAHAEAAWAVVDRTMFNNPAGALGDGIRQDIHHAPRLQGLALVYDLCHEAWSAERRDRVARELAQRTHECAHGLFEGKVMSGFNPNWWSNHNAVRMGAVALGALALLEERDGTDVPYLPEAAELARAAGRELRGWLEYGMGRSGWCPEGNHYKFMTFRRGWSHGMWALRTALGQDYGAGLMEDMIAGYLLEADPGHPFPHINTYDGHALDGTVESGHLRNPLFSLHGKLIPERYLPGLKSLAEQTLSADTWGIVEPMHGPYAIAGWPRTVAAATPGSVLPWMVADPVHGHSVFRPRYQDGDDILLVLNQCSHVKNGYHYERAGVPGDLRLWAHGRRYAYGRSLPVIDGVPFTEPHGPEVLAVEDVAGQRIHLIHLDLANAYLGPVPKERRADAAVFAKEVGGIGLRRIPHFNGQFVDYGIRGRRSIVVDATGASGTPLLIAIRDRLWREDAQGASSAVTAQLPFPYDKNLVPAIDGTRFCFPSGSPKCLVVDCLGSQAVAGDGTSTFSGEHCWVIAVNDGTFLHKCRADGDPLQRVEIGRRILLIADDRLRIDD